jgi:hypothetical protein
LQSYPTAARTKKKKMAKSAALLLFATLLALASTFTEVRRVFVRNLFSAHSTYIFQTEQMPVFGGLPLVLWKLFEPQSYAQMQKSYCAAVGRDRQLEDHQEFFEDVIPGSTIRCPTAEAPPLRGIPSFTAVEEEVGGGATETFQQTSTEIDVTETFQTSTDATTTTTATTIAAAAAAATVERKRRSVARVADFGRDSDDTAMTAGREIGREIGRAVLNFLRSSWLQPRPTPPPRTIVKCSHADVAATFSALGGGGMSTRVPTMSSNTAARDALIYGDGI